MQTCTDSKEPTMNLHTPACNTTLGLGLSSSPSASSVINMAPCAAATPPSSSTKNTNNNILQQQPPPVYATPFSYNTAAMAPFQLHRFEPADQISSTASAGYGVCSTTRQAPPVQLELLPLRPAHAAAAPVPPGPPPQYPHAAAMNPFISWQQQQRTAPQLPAATMNMPMQMMMNTHLANASSMVHHVRSIDVNQIPPVAEGEDAQVAESSPTAAHAGFSSMVTEAALCRTSTDTASAGTTQLLPKREREKLSSDIDQDRTCEVSSRASDEEAEGGGTRKKLRLSKEQSSLLEESFKEHSTLNPKQKAALAKQLNLRPRQVEVWFQNRRARTKLKQTEVDCELLKRCCESLTEENRRLQKEVQELRAIKVAPPCVIAHDLYMPLPAATLTMCPSCERLATLADNGRTLGFAKPNPPHHQALSQPSAAC